MTYKEAGEFKYTLTGGFTQNIVQRDGEFVTKTGKTAEDEAIWYNHYLDKEDIPKIIESNSVSLKMEFIESSGAYTVEEVIELVEKYKSYQPLNKLTFKSYYENILKHVEKSDISNGHILIDKLKTISLEPTFAHGDLSVRNIIKSDRVKLIDPLYYRNFGSYILDLCKFAFTLKFYNGNWQGFDLVKAHVNLPYFDVLVACECVRVATYNKKFDFIAENLINEL